MKQMMTKRVIPAVLAGLVASAGLADTMMLGMVANGTVVNDQPLAAPFAICLLGGGAIDPVVDALLERGFVREDDTEMQITTLSSPEAEFTVALYEDGAICDVTSEEIGTDGALMTLMVIGGLVGFEGTGSDCTAIKLAGAVAEVTSSGNDPVCFDGGTSNVRFSFAE